MAVKYKDREQFHLEHEVEAAKNLLSHLRAMGVDDEDTVHDSIEGETSFLEAVTEVVKAIREEEAHAYALKEYEASLKARRERKEQRQEALRAALQVAFSTAFEGREDEAKAKTPFGTLRLANDPAKAIITDESLIPSKYWKPQEPKLDKKELLSDLKKLGKEETISGATLSQGGKHIVISKS